MAWAAQFSILLSCTSDSKLVFRSGIELTTTSNRRLSAPRMGRDSPDSRGVTCTSLYVRNLMVPSNPYIIISISATTVINISGPDWNARSYASRKSNDSLHR